MANDFDIEIIDGKKTLTKYNGSEQNIIIPNEVEIIGPNAFENCSQVTSVDIPGNVTIIAYFAFLNCKNLVSVVICEGVRLISNGAFAGCTNLTSINLPIGVRDIYEDVFDGCNRLEINLYYNHKLSEPSFMKGLRNQYINLLDEENRRIGKLFILDEKTNNPDKEFSSRLMSGQINNLSEYDAIFPFIDEIVIRKARAALCRLEYPLELLDEYKKGYINYLLQHVDLIIPFMIKVGDVTSISTLANVSAIPTENINNYIETTNKNSQTEILALLLSYQNKTSRRKNLPALGLEHDNSQKDWLTHVNEDESLTIIKYLGKDLDIIIPAIINGMKVKSIEGHLGSLKVSAFFPHEIPVQTIVIDEGIEVIGERAFLECRNLKSVVIPKSVMRIGKDAFSGCVNLASVVIPESVAEISEQAFICCSSITSLIISEGVNIIENGAFIYCTSLTSLRIPSTVSRIGNGCFRECANLTSIIIPKEVTSIGWLAFDECKNLVIESPKGSYAIDYAKKNVIKYLEM
jgi:hypothetical protein